MALSYASPTEPIEGAVQLLTVMFRRSRVCRRSLVDLVAEVNYTLMAADRLLRFLTAIGFLSKERRFGAVPNTYRLHLPQPRQPHAPSAC
jgi:hypothetical protein